jgi:hypothetical protein
MITPKISDHACATIPGRRLLRHRASSPNRTSEQSDSNNPADSFVEMANAEHYRLEQYRPSSGTGDRPKLLLKITAKREFLTKTRGERNWYPHQALENPSGEKPLRGIGSTAIVLWSPSLDSFTASCRAGTHNRKIKGRHLPAWLIIQRAGEGIRLILNRLGWKVLQERHYTY